MNAKWENRLLGPVSLRSLILVLVLAFALGGLVAPADGKRGITERKTLGHEWLAREFKASPVSSLQAGARYALLDAIIDDVANRLLPRFPVSDPVQARNALRTIDRVLAERRFYVSMPTRALKDSLEPSPPPRSVRRLLTPLRREMIGHNPKAPCHRMDCDTGSAIYASAGEALRLPISIVEVPGHKFVRWKLGGGRYMNWDTNAAREYSDAEFRLGKTLTYSVRLSSAEEAAGKYLTPLSREQAVAYHRNIVAEIYQERRRYQSAATEYRAALAVRPYDSLAANNLAWLYLENRSLRTRGNVAAALNLARTAASVLPKNRDYLDTLARALAANGRFDEAIAVEKRSYRKSKHIRLFKSRKSY
jgi:tetratricopeptide (TPR) repeat protein